MIEGVSVYWAHPLFVYGFFWGLLVMWIDSFDIRT